jgi:predicted AAA+ superfamily ATPase
MVWTRRRASGTLEQVERIYEAALREHQVRHRQMAFVTGPRQVGKTTSCRAFAAEPPSYVTWDDPESRALIARGPGAVAESLGLRELQATPPTVVFDEVHRFPRWKSFLKGFFDLHEKDVRVVVTGISRLGVYQRGGDSLMGRYFLYRMHPLSVGEIVDASFSTEEVRPPAAVDEEAFQALCRFGGFPEPFLKADTRFANRWRRLREQQLLREDLRDLTRVQELAQLQVLAELVGARSGQLLNKSTLAVAVGASVDTIGRWLKTLETLHHSFAIQPWFKNVAKSLRKMPKLYLRDWSIVEDAGARFETFVACHLLKAVEWWEDLGLGDYRLCYLRDKEKREVDFVVIRNGKPWFLVEAKASGHELSGALDHFQRQTRAEHAFQVTLELDYVEADCFKRTTPTVVPARTLLSQLP